LTKTFVTATALASLLALNIAPARADEISELKAALQALQKRIDQLETKAQEVEDTNDRQTDQIAKVRSNVGAWVGNFTWKGDLRYRNENIDQAYVVGRNRDRLRLRTGFVAKANDTLRVEMQLATAESGDPRSSNQTLTGSNSRKPIYIDLAYGEWKPTNELTLTFGKMKYPWVRPGSSVLFDGDVSPEGIALGYNDGALFGSTFYTQLKENATSAESSMGGGQVGYRFNINSSSKLMLAAGYFSYNKVRYQSPFFDGTSNFGNTLLNTTVGDLCYSTQFSATAPKLCWGYQVAEGIAEFSTLVDNRPLSVYGDYTHNSEAKNALDTAYSLGFMYGRASDPQTWEMGYYWQRVQKDALFAQYIDSDFGGGNSDAEGGVIKAAYAPARNWTLNLTYFMNKTNLAVPVSVTGMGSVYNREYKRLQLDANVKF